MEQWNGTHPTKTLCSPRNARRELVYTQLRSDAIDKIQARKAMRAEYAHLQLQLDKNRPIICIGSCILCLCIGFMAGVIITPPGIRQW